MRFLLSLALGCLVLSGCSGAAEPAKAPTSAPAAPATVTADTGGVEGLVVDDEAAPVSGAEVAQTQANLVTSTDAAGKFSFSDLAPGTYSLVAQRLGYESMARKVEVKAGEITEVTATLVPLAIVEPYTETLIFNGYIRFGNAFLDIVTSLFGLPGCEKCIHYWNATADVQSIVFEVDFKPTVPNPSGTTVLYTQIWDETGTKTTYVNEDWPPRNKRQLDKKWPEEGEKFRQYLFCDALYVCAEQRYTEYVSLFHNAMPGETFTAFPPS